MRWESLSAAAVQFSSDTQSALRVESFLCPRNQFSACYRSGFLGTCLSQASTSLRSHLLSVQDFWRRFRPGLFEVHREQRAALDR